MRSTLLAFALILLLAGCSGSHREAGPGAGSGTLSATASATTSTTPLPLPTPTRASSAPRPVDGACYRLSYDAALAPSSDASAVKCRRPHTAQTFAVADLDPIVEGHLLAVDSARVQTQVADACPQQLGAYLGGTEDQRRLSALRAVWFTPTVAESDAGAGWYRCDVIAVAAQGELSTLPRHVQGALDHATTRDRFGVCGTDAPDAADFERVICSRTHSWRAISVVDLPAGKYPGEDSVKAAGQVPCKAAGADVAQDKLDYKWGYEYPSAREWRAGQTYGVCWAPG